jgi:hypothetical protein
VTEPLPLRGNCLRAFQQDLVIADENGAEREVSHIDGPLSQPEGVAQPAHIVHDANLTLRVV